MMPNVKTLTEIAHFFELMEKMEMGIALTDEDGIYIKLNTEYSRMYGYDSPSELIGESILTVFTQHHLGSVCKSYQAICQGKLRSYPIETKLIQPSGKVLDVELNWQYYIESSLQISYQLHGIRNLSQTQHYQQLVSQMQKSGQIGGWEFDLTTGKKTWTTEVYEIYEVASDFEANPENLMRFYTSESSSILNEAFNSAISDGKSFDLELQLVTMAENKKWVKITCQPIQLGKKVQKLLGTLQDISWTKQRESELYKLSLLAKYTTNAVVITNSSGEIEWVNDGFVKLNGHTLSEVRGKKPGGILHGEKTCSSTTKRISKKLRQKQLVREEVYNYRKNGEGYWISLEVTPIFEQGQLLHFVGVSTEISQRKKAEADHQRLIIDLMEKNKNLAEVAFITSHKLRKPLANILGLIDLLNTPQVDNMLKENILKQVFQLAQELDEEMHYINDTVGKKCNNNGYQTFTNCG